MFKSFAGKQIPICRHWHAKSSCSNAWSVTMPFSLPNSAQYRQFTVKVREWCLAQKKFSVTVYQTKVTVRERTHGFMWSEQLPQASPNAPVARAPLWWIQRPGRPCRDDPHSRGVKGNHLTTQSSKLHRPTRYMGSEDTDNCTGC